MDIEQIKTLLNPLIGIPFANIFTPSEMAYIIKSKGRGTSIIELLLSRNYQQITYNNELFNFDISIIKCNNLGHILETIPICQISSIIDYWLYSQDFYSSNLFINLRNRLFIPICKEGSPYEWYMFPLIHLNYNNSNCYKIFSQFELDYINIRNQLNDFIHNSNDGMIQTCNGRFIQIRSKDSIPYSPLYSTVYNRYISNKNHAVYLKKEFFIVMQSIFY